MPNTIHTSLSSTVPHFLPYQCNPQAGAYSDKPVCMHAGIYFVTILIFEKKYSPCNLTQILFFVLTRMKWLTFTWHFSSWVTSKRSDILTAADPNSRILWVNHHQQYKTRNYFRSWCCQSIAPQRKHFIVCDFFFKSLPNPLANFFFCQEMVVCDGTLCLHAGVQSTMWWYQVEGE